MIHTSFKNQKLSMLGMGAMRLPLLEDNSKDIDKIETSKMVAYAMEKGINYFDTAWGYHGGNSEIVIGEILKSYPRESYFLATKFPGYSLANMDKVEEIFEKQLEKCQVEYFDFYMFHNVCEMNIDAYLDDEKYGIHSYLVEQMRSGRIRHLGFSAHGDVETMKRFLEKYGSTMEYCQIQLNYLDYHFQDAKAKIELLSKYNIPVWVMEPLRGGMLANLNEEYAKRLKALRPDESDPAWAFRFLQSLGSVKVILSGMSNFEQLQQNIETFSTANPLNKEEMSTLMDIANKMINAIALPCTGCDYCTSHCSKQLAIPQFIKLYNEHVFTGGGFIAPMALSSYPSEKQPSSCIHCKRCEAVCPQQIKISDMMSDFVERIG